MCTNIYVYKINVFDIFLVIIFLPLTSIQHFIEPLSYCLLADICNHTWVPECGRENDTEHLRLFLDECDLFEYNCDNDYNYIITNYSDCFSQECPTMPKYYITYHPKMLTGTIPKVHAFQPLRAFERTVTRPNNPAKKTKPGKRRYTPEVAKRRRRMMMNQMFKTTPCAPCMRGKKNPFYAYMKPQPPRRKKSGKTLPKPKPPSPTKPVITARFTKQVIRTATRGTVELQRVTFYKNGMMLFKVIKGFATTTAKEDSDFLE